MKVLLRAAAGLLCAALPVFAQATNDLFTVRYPAGTNADELAVEAAFHLWLPPKVTEDGKNVRAIIVHQHGCGEGAERSGETAALDLQWRALAAKHDAALLSPHYSAGSKPCRDWCDPRKGSASTFRRALIDLGKRTRHPEIAQAPWCLWGHSGGGYWASLMLAELPERIVAVWCRSGAAPMWAKETGPVNFPAAAYGVPVVLNPGLKERGDARFNGAWEGTFKFFEEFRAKGAPVAFAPDPLSSHDCRNSRLLAIPFFDACLQARLSYDGHTLRGTQIESGFLGDWQTGETRNWRKGTNALSWLPNDAVARAFKEYVKTGLVRDDSRPRQSATVTRAVRVANGVLLEWTARADMQSGIKQFAIYRDRKRIALVPEKTEEKNGFTQFQGLSYHDTPSPVIPRMEFVDTNAPSAGEPAYAVAIISGAGVEGSPGKAVKAGAQ